MQDFVKSIADFSLALSLFTVDQSSKVLNGIPTSDPTLKARESFQQTSAAIQAPFSPIIRSTYGIGKTVQDAVIDVSFNFFTPSTFNPITIVDTSQNVLRWGLGLAVQFLPGGSTGGPPTGWGPVNREDATFIRF